MPKSVEELDVKYGKEEDRRMWLKLHPTLTWRTTEHQGYNRLGGSSLSSSKVITTFLNPEVFTKAAIAPNNRIPIKNTSIQYLLKATKTTKDAVLLPYSRRLGAETA
jgi:hypothetical protein